MRFSREFLTNFEVFGNMVKHSLECFQGNDVSCLSKLHVKLLSFAIVVKIYASLVLIKYPNTIMVVISFKLDELLEKCS